ncbi:glycosyltransferase family 2 protein [Robiginitomaculum antarcticum]|uniref:glycosyltransferase family 2 protein n=1 Tax=Robiginitomaculum antarcticum TaxID=437507 RepID=UPI0003789EE3|nr:glycosyltransferase family 2 protein [Robiginitomaculum antarcticum]
MAQPKIAILLPAYNEEDGIAPVIEGFAKALPQARIVVCDNNSSDATAERARAAGAELLFQALPGKGNAMRRLFREIRADIYIMCDADGSYDASAAPRLIKMMTDNKLDMIVAARESENSVYRPGHAVGNRFFTWLMGAGFGRHFTDIFSGYRVFSERYVRSFPMMSDRFEIEAEMTIHALELRLPFAEVPVAFFDRIGGESKLSTFRDGARIAWLMGRLYRDQQPLRFFTFGAFIIALTSLAIGIPVIWEFWQTGLVTKMPSAILAAALMIGAALSFTCGVVLDTVKRARIAQKLQAYMNYADEER